MGFLNSLVLQDLLAKASQKIFWSHDGEPNLPSKCWIKPFGAKTSPLKSDLSKGLQALDAVQSPQKRNDWTPTMELEMMQVSYFGAPLIPQSHKANSRKFKVSTKKKLSDRMFKKNSTVPNLFNL